MLRQFLLIKRICELPSLTEPGAWRASSSERLAPVDAKALKRPGPEIVSPAIPLFFIGRDHDGFWIARDADGETGGLFLFRKSAVRFANESARARGWESGATMSVPQPFELDIENRGNALINILRSAKRLGLRLWSGAKHFASTIGRRARQRRQEQERDFYRQIDEYRRAHGLRPIDRDEWRSWIYQALEERLR